MGCENVNLIKAQNRYKNFEAPYPVGKGRVFLREKVAGRWSWPLTFI